MTAAILTFSIILSTHTVHALSGFNYGTILSDTEMTDNKSMSASRIQQFLILHGQTCTDATCLQNYSENNKSASQIIYETAQTYSINPQVLLTLLEVEHNLITASSVLQDELDDAMGMSCSPPGCTPSFTSQVVNAASVLHSIMIASSTPSYSIGSATLDYSQNTACGSLTFTITNKATSALYSYPNFHYVPNNAALAADLGDGDGCSSYAIRNFYINYHQWFDSLNVFTYTPVYRFWGDTYKGHFYTIDTAEKDNVVRTMSNIWKYEGQKLSVPTQDSIMCRGLPSVYRFWSNTYRHHFYTTSEAEKNNVISTMSNIWTYEGPRFCASNYQTKQTPTPVYRFWSSTYKGHFYTVSEAEKNNVISTMSNIWTYEGIAYYANS